MPEDLQTAKQEEERKDTCPWYLKKARLPRRGTCAFPAWLSRNWHDQSKAKGGQDGSVVYGTCCNLIT